MTGSTATEQKQINPPAATSNTPELARPREVAIPKQEEEAAASKAKQVESLVPTQIKPPEGKTTIEGDHPIESQILAYKMLDKVAQTLTKRLARSTSNTVVIYNESEINALLVLKSFASQLDLIEEHLRTEIDNAKTVIADAKAAVEFCSAADRGRCCGCHTHGCGRVTPFGCHVFVAL